MTIEKQSKSGMDIAQLERLLDEAIGDAKQDIIIDKGGHPVDYTPEQYAAMAHADVLHRSALLAMTRNNPSGRNEWELAA